MRLVEEKKSVKLQMISLLGLIVTTILLQVANYKIDNASAEVSLRALDVVILAQRRLDYKLNHQFENIKSTLPFENVKFHDDYWSGDYIDEDAIQFKDDYEKGLIDTKEYFKRSAEHARQQSNTMRVELNEKIETLNDLIAQSTPWKSIRPFLVIVQIVAVCILINGYYDLFKSISLRSNKSK